MDIALNAEDAEMLRVVNGVAASAVEAGRARLEVNYSEGANGWILWPANPRACRAIVIPDLKQATVCLAPPETEAIMEIWNADRDTLLAELHTRLGAVVEGRYEQTVETRTRRRDRIKVVGIFHLAAGDEGFR